MNPSDEPKPSSPQRSRWRLIIALAAGLVVAVAAGWQIAAQVLKEKVIRALGPDSEVGSLRIGRGGVVIRDLRLPAPEGWPTEDTLRAAHVVIEPDLRSLFSERYSIRKVTVRHGYLSVLRDDDRRLRVLPTLLDKRRRKDANYHPPLVSIGSIELLDSALDFHDTSLKDGASVRLRFGRVQARLEDLAIPEFDGRSRLHAEGVVKGSKQDGTARVDGWVQIGNRASELTTQVRGIDLVKLEPYLLRAAEDGVESGTLDLDMHSKVENRHLDARGKLTLNDLHLRSGGGFAGTFLGVPRRAVIGSMKSGGDDLSLDFTMKGDLGDTKFSLNETLSVRVAVGLAQTLGVGLVDVVKGVGDLGGRGLGAVGDAVGSLFGADEDAEPEQNSGQKPSQKPDQDKKQ